MDDRTGTLVGVLGTVGLFLCVQVGALALVEPYVAAGAQPVEDPSDPGNVGLFFAVILVATAAMLAAIRYDLQRVIRGVVLFACGWVSWFVVSTVIEPLEPADLSATTDVALFAAVNLLPFAIGAGIVGALLFHPEWYVIDAAGVLLGAGAAGLFGYAFQPHLTIAFLVVLAVYDAVSVYGTEHMLTLAKGVSDLNVPVLLVVPTTRSYSLLRDDGPSSIDRSAVDESTAGDDPLHEETAGAPESAEGKQGDAPEEAVRDAIYIGLGDAVMPTILVASAAYFLPPEAPLYDVPVLAVNAPALGALLGTLSGLLVLLWLVLKGRPHAGLPLLNGGAIAGYLVGAVVSGIAVVDALGLPI